MLLRRRDDSGVLWPGRARVVFCCLCLLPRLYPEPHADFVVSHEVCMHCMCPAQPGLQRARCCPGPHAPGELWRSAASICALPHRMDGPCALRAYEPRAPTRHCSVWCTCTLQLLAGEAGRAEFPGLRGPSSHGPAADGQQQQRKQKRLKQQQQQQREFLESNAQAACLQATRLNDELGPGGAGVQGMSSHAGRA